MRKTIFTFLLMTGSLAVSSAQAQSQQLSSDPCPQIMEAAKQSPGDLAAVQADIERYTLCVQRAVLLQRLNELASKNEQDMSPAFSLDNIEGLPYGREEIEQMVTNLRAREQEVNDLIASNVPDAPQQTNQSESAVKKGPSYVVSELMGSGGDMKARITDSDQVPYTVSVGDSLPDDSTVVSISATGVVVVKDSKQTTLSWGPASRDGGL